MPALYLKRGERGRVPASRRAAPPPFPGLPFWVVMFCALVLGHTGASGNPERHADMPDERVNGASDHLPVRHALLPSAQDQTHQNGVTSFLFTERAEKMSVGKGNGKWADPAVIAYVPFGKTGSSTMRQMVSAAGPFCDGLGAGVDAPKRCPDGGTVQTLYGYCEALQATQGCNYLTMLRDPVAQKVSAWNYFCRSCQEHGRGCYNVPAQLRGSGTQKPAWLQAAIKHNAELPKDKDGIPVGILQQVCPYYSLVEYVRDMGNEYTRMFGTMPGCQGEGCLSHEKGPGKYERIDGNRTCKFCAASDQDMPKEVLEEAMRALERPDMLVLPMERMQTPAGLKALGKKFHYDFSRFANLHDNGGGSREEATAEELETLNVLLAPDIALYKKVLARFEKEHPE